MGCVFDNISSITLVFLIIGQLAASLVSKSVFVRPKVLLLSLGGFRDDYVVATEKCPTLKRFISDGVRAEYVQNSINVESLVNLYGIASGLYAESHGIVAETMLDFEIGKIFRNGTHDDPAWWRDVNPIWLELEKQGVGKAGVCHWPGVYGPMLPRYNCEGRPYLFKSDIDTILDWFMYRNVSLGLIHMDAIKKAAIRWGPQSTEVFKELEIFDFLFKYLLQRIKDDHIDVNIIITSDCGVIPINWQHVIDLDECIDPRSYYLLHAQGTLLFYPKEGYRIAVLYKDLKKCPHLEVYLRQKLPKRYHYSNHKHIAPVIGFAPDGAVVRSSKPTHNEMNKMLDGDSPKIVGATGYKPKSREMNAVFYAGGPSFRNGLKTNVINNTDIYPILCHLLGTQPKPNNGSDKLAEIMFDAKTLLKMQESNARSKTQLPSSWSTTRRLSSDHHINRNSLFGDLTVTGIAIFLIACGVVMLIILCVGCFRRSWKNFKNFKGKTSVYPPHASRRLLSQYSSSSDEE